MMTSVPGDNDDVGTCNGWWLWFPCWLIVMAIMLGYDADPTFTRNPLELIKVSHEPPPKVNISHRPPYTTCTCTKFPTWNARTCDRRLLYVVVNQSREADVNSDALTCSCITPSHKIWMNKIWSYQIYSETQRRQYTRYERASISLFAQVRLHVVVVAASCTCSK